jgi:hypothetical protein
MYREGSGRQDLRKVERATTVLLALRPVKKQALDSPTFPRPHPPTPLAWTAWVTGVSWALACDGSADHVGPDQSAGVSLAKRGSCQIAGGSKTKKIDTLAFGSVNLTCAAVT